MFEPAPPPLDEQSLFESMPRLGAQIAAVVVASVALVVVLNSLGVFGDSGDEAASSTTVRVAQLPPAPSSSESPATGTGESTTGTAGTSDDPVSTPAGTSGTGTAGTTAGTAATTGTTGTTGSTTTGTPGSGTTGPSGSSAAQTGSPAAAPRIAEVSASAVRADSVDDCGAPTSYQPVFAVDSVRETAWMVPGDGVGAVFTIELVEPAVVSEVGLVPGYDKSDPCSGTDRFDELRRVTAVRWSFDDGTSIDQDVIPTPDLQTTTLESPVTTARVSMTVLATTEAGLDRLDYTAVSEIAVS